MIICNKCSKFGLEYNNSNLNSPSDFIEGNLDAKVWIIGLNPKTNQNEIFDPSFDDLRNFKPSNHSYFKDFKKVSNKLYENWESKNSKIAHTDLVKCGSASFPPAHPVTSKKLSNKETNVIINNCFEHLKNQLLIHKPLLLICNGSYTSESIFNFFSPDDLSIKSIKSVGSYKSTFEGHTFTIVLSGFIGRIDDWSKRRLGLEIENAIDNLGIKL
ncbi:uracil-DNA glycosylase family protein [Polaribacter gangjinensis]|uniref:Uracil-DNA glycosylase-like domain-containing protein n=1 Tax=Polaribacter gangjinensis TaxID=574710 RepID=A0A2S7WBZ1_9FLAO|nr:uracil-DNA glycosylase family protein [Polaribacter gangjinensis]PQJ74762.1 hypothetical protein BTO13_05620 [Polaribacter gangjinensis]